MADDTMEISSEHGHNMGDEDIDIDIDFTAGQVDEDYVLEDAASIVGFGDDLPQPSPIMGHDDMMTDEYEETFTVPMDGEEFMRDDDNHNMEHEPIDASFTAANIPNVLVDEEFLEAASSAVADGAMNEPEVTWEGNNEPEQSQDVARGEIKESEVTWETNEPHDEPEEVHIIAHGEMKESEVTWDTNDEPEQESHEADVHQEDSNDQEHHVAPGEAGDTSQNADNKDTKAFPATDLHDDSNSNSPHNMSPDSSAGLSISGSPSASISRPASGSHGDAPEHANEGIGILPSSQGIINTVESTNAEVTSTSLIPEVRVVYQDSDYSLFSKSEADDIDSYFLSDLSIKEKPLTDFFEAIRHVIRDDISDDDELCLSVEDLDIVVEEMSSLTGTVTIGQIIDLHGKLTHNDGEGSFGPPCLLLGKRPKLLSRFAYLSSGAAEGKGLSELVEWDEHSEGFDESAHITVNEHEEDLEADNDEARGVAGDQETDLHQQAASDDSMGHKSTAEHELPEEVAGVDNGAASSIATSNGHGTNGSVTNLSPAEDVLSIQKSGTAGDDHEEDGDLIDYSDEEAQAPPGPRKDARLRAAKLETDDNRAHNEYEAINEDLRRRSLSRTAEENLPEQVADTKDFEVRNDKQNFETTENNVEYDENEKEHVEHSNVAEEHEDQSGDYGEHDAAEPYNDEDDFFVEDGDADGPADDGEILDGLESRSEPIDGAAQENLDEFDFGGDDTQQHQEFPEFADQMTTYHDDINYDKAAKEHTSASTKDIIPGGNALGYADAADSDSAASERTLEAQSISVGELPTEIKGDYVDEIDYDEDDELDTVKVLEPLLKELQAPISSSGKRQRTDDDGASTGSQDAKRARS